MAKNNKRIYPIKRQKILILLLGVLVSLILPLYTIGFFENGFEVLKKLIFFYTWGIFTPEVLINIGPLIFFNYYPLVGTILVSFWGFFSLPAIFYVPFVCGVFGVSLSIIIGLEKGSTKIIGLLLILFLMLGFVSFVSNH